MIHAPALLARLVGAFHHGDQIEERSFLKVGTNAIAASRPACAKQYPVMLQALKNLHEQRKGQTMMISNLTGRRNPVGSFRQAGKGDDRVLGLFAEAKHRL